MTVARPGPAGQPVAGVDHQHLRVGRDLAGDQLAAGRVVGEHRHVCLAGAQRCGDAVPFGGDDADPFAAPGEPADRVADHPAQGTSAGRDGDLVFSRVELGEEIRERAARILRVGGQLAARPGQHQASPAPLVKGQAEGRAQLRDFHVRRGLAQLQLGRGGGEIAVSCENSDGWPRTASSKGRVCDRPTSVSAGNAPTSAATASSWALTHFVDDQPEVHEAIRGAVAHQFHFGPQRRPVPPPGRHTPSWAEVERQIHVTLAGELPRPVP